jgi:hypothetical protein
MLFLAFNCRLSSSYGDKQDLLKGEKGKGEREKGC